MLNVENIENFREYGQCISVSNEEIEVVVSKNFGPRILYYGFKGGFNHLCEHGKLTMDIDGEEFKMYGGHRFWHSPEQAPRTYMPDNDPVKVEILDNGIRLTQNIEKWTQLQKTIEIILPKNGTKIEVIHYLKNCNAFEIEVALWALTVMATGGIEILPLNTDETGFLANRFISIWPYTDLKDDRLDINNDYILLKQTNKEKPLKLGVCSNLGMCAYLNKGELFTKEFSYEEGVVYPDGNCNYETYTTDYMLEMESLSPLYKIPQGGIKKHTETWSLKKYDEKDVDYTKLVEDLKLRL